MLNKTIVIVEDEPDILEILTYNLKREGFNVLSADNGPQGLALIKQHLPDIALLDLMLPGMDGLEICQQVRSDTSCAHIPIIMVTAKCEESDIVIGLGLGADDYISKPFSPKELIARIKALLRRGHQLAATTPATDQIITVAGLSIDPVKHKVTVDGKKIKLTATEFRLLNYLAEHPGRVFSREQLMDNAYSNDVVIVDRNIDVHVRAIRKKIGVQNNFIETVRGFGYRFADQERS